jgi:hypothetical protein
MEQKGSTTARRKGLRFPSDEELFAACEVLEKLREERVVEFDIVAGSEAIVLPTRVYNLAVEHLTRAGLKFWELKVVPANLLKPDDQAARRGLLRRQKRIA